MYQTLCEPLPMKEPQMNDGSSPAVEALVVIS